MVTHLNAINLNAAISGKNLKLRFSLLLLMMLPSLSLVSLLHLDHTLDVQCANHWPSSVHAARHACESEWATELVLSSKNSITRLYGWRELLKISSVMLVYRFTMSKQPSCLYFCFEPKILDRNV